MSCDERWSKKHVPKEQAQYIFQFDNFQKVNIEWTGSGLCIITSSYTNISCSLNLPPWSLEEISDGWFTPEQQTPHVTIASLLCSYLVSCLEFFSKCFTLAFSSKMKWAGCHDWAVHCPHAVCVKSLQNVTSEQPQVDFPVSRWCFLVENKWTLFSRSHTVRRRKLLGFTCVGHENTSSSFTAKKADWKLVKRQLHSIF